MVKEVKRISIVIMMLLFLSSCWSFGAGSINQDAVTVYNLLPEVIIYADGPERSNMDAENLKVYVNDEDTEISFTGAFKDSGEGILFYYLVDSSASLTEEEMDSIKKTLLTFNKSLGEKDRVILIPFGETVYGDEKTYKANSENLIDQIKALDAKDAYTQLYAAMDKAANIDPEVQENMRKVAIVFSDGMDDTDEGGILTKEEAINQMKDNAIPMYALATGNNKAGKDLLGETARKTGGSYFNLNKGEEVKVAERLHNRIDSTFVFRVSVKNSEDIINNFTVRVLENDEELLIKENITAHKDAETRDSKEVIVKKTFMKYRWLIAVALVGIIIFAALMYVRKNKGVVNVDGKIVYGSKIQKKYYVKVKEFNKREIECIISINGGSSYRQKITIEESIIVGRSKICDLIIDDKATSRQHFAIELKKGELYLKDLESTGGTWLNGKQISAPEKLTGGDVIVAGRVSIKLVL